MMVASQLHTVQLETFERENFRKFRGFAAICESFLRKIWRCGVLWQRNWQHQQAICKSFLCKNLIFRQFVKVFSCKNFPPYVQGRSLMKKDRICYFYHLILQVNFEEQCQTYLEPPYDEIFAAHIRYIHT